MVIVVHVNNDSKKFTNAWHENIIQQVQA